MDTYNRFLSLPLTTYVTIPGVIVDVEASGDTEVNFETPRGRFSVKPLDLTVGEPQEFLDGAVRVDRVPVAELISAPDSHDDFVALLSGPGKTMLTAWIGYRGAGDRIYVTRGNGETWEVLPSPNQRPGDRFWVKLGARSNETSVGCLVGAARRQLGSIRMLLWMETIGHRSSA